MVVVFPELMVGSVEASRSVQAPCSVVLAVSVNIRIASSGDIHPRVISVIGDIRSFLRWSPWIVLHVVS